MKQESSKSHAEVGITAMKIRISRQFRWNVGLFWLIPIRKRQNKGVEAPRTPDFCENLPVQNLKFCVTFATFIYICGLQIQSRNRILLNRLQVCEWGALKNLQVKKWESIKTNSDRSPDMLCENMTSSNLSPNERTTARFSETRASHTRNNAKKIILSSRAEY